ncbi:MAG TPA: D-alanine--D-alanine ligase [Candidatus Methylacidiphilales bacterium]|jgi:D-alanine-D-alanine ligase|nr:D-alanine--D-alanine ligase [Candidatus Methylacidiphilales bacterium]
MSDKPHRIAVLKGGPSAEREVSLRSGMAAAEALREAGYEVGEVVVDDAGFVVPAGTDLAFLALHGTFGEDGQIQKILDARGIPYTGAGAEVSRIAFDKEKTKEKLRQRGVPTPEGRLVRRIEEITLPLPVFIKPNAQGSSVGTHPATTREELASALADALKFDTDVLVEQLIKGRELTVGVLGDQALPIVEIRPLDGFYDYANKYTKGRTEYFCPAPLPEEISSLVRQYALAAHRAIGDPVYSRIDFLLEDDVFPYCLEINTIPGMTATSLLPKAAAAVGITFPQLCRRIVELSWAARQKERNA